MVIKVTLTLRVVVILVLIGRSKITKHPKASTLYLSIPAGMAKDSQFDLKEGDRVKLIYNSTVHELIVKKGR